MWLRYESWGCGGRFSTAVFCVFLFFFQAEDGIRDYKVTGVQTCALPICERRPAGGRLPLADHARDPGRLRRRKAGWDPRLLVAGDASEPRPAAAAAGQIGRASCRERV